MLKDANDRLALMQKLQRDTLPGQMQLTVAFHTTALCRGFKLIPPSTSRLRWTRRAIQHHCIGLGRCLRLFVRCVGLLPRLPPFTFACFDRIFSWALCSDQ